MSETENEVLLRAVLSQLDGKLDYKKLAEDTGASNASAAWKRWDRYKKKLFTNAASLKKPSTSKPVNQSSPKTPKNTTTPKAPMTPKSKNEIKLKRGRVTKKRKAEALGDNEESGETQNGNGIKDSGDEDEAVWENDTIESPTKRLPARKKRATINFKEDSLSEEDDIAQSVEVEIEDDIDTLTQGYAEDVDAKEHFFDCDYEI